MILLFIILCFLLPIPQNASGKEPSSKTHFYFIEYTKPIHPARISILHVTFFIEVTPAQCEKILRIELGQAIELFPLDNEVMAFAWFSSTGVAGEEWQIKLLDGSGSLIFSPKNNRIFTSKEYTKATLPEVKPAQLLEIFLDIELETSRSGYARVQGKTNLPNGMSLMVGLHDRNYNYNAQSKVIVKQGRFLSEWFNKQGKRLLEGVYIIEISSPITDLQPPEVREIIGQKGERMVGKYVEFGEYGPRITLNKTVIIQ